MLLWLFYDSTFMLWLTASGIFLSPYSQCGVEFRYRRYYPQKSVLVQSVCEGFGLPSCNDLRLQFLFFCQCRRVALKLDQSNPAKKSHLHRFASRQANSIQCQLILVLCTYWHKSIWAWASNMQLATIFVVEIALDVMSLRHMMDYDIEVIYIDMQKRRGQNF